MKDSQSGSAAESGFGMIEVVVSMLMIALLAIAVLPVLIQGLRVSADNSTLATATQILNDKLEAARSIAPQCSLVYSSLNGTETATLVDPRGLSFRVDTVVDSCPASITSARTIAVTVTVTRVDTNVALAKAATRVLVSS
jgi:type II secretory pathway pseudopilin PulG